MRPYPLLSLLVAFLFLQLPARGANCRHITTADGLSNMSVTSLTIDRDGYVWASTCDGINLLENNAITTFAAGDNGRNEFSGNLVENIRQDSVGNLWVHTNYGLDFLDARTGQITYHRDINGLYFDALAPDGMLAVVCRGDSIRISSDGTGSFSYAGQSPVNLGSVGALALDSGHSLWIAAPDGVYAGSLDSATGRFSFKKMFSEKIRDAWLDRNVILLISEAGDLEELDIKTGLHRKIMTLPSPVTDKWGASAIIRDGDDYIIGYTADGAVRLKKDADGYSVIPFDIKTGVFTVVKDPHQDILWFGTDGDGIYYYTPGAYTFSSQTTAGADRRFAKPVRSLYADTEGNVWVGTKGDGLFCFRNFQPGGRNDDVRHYTAADSPLPDNDIYALAPSRHGLFWIGTQGFGLAYWSLTDHALHYLPVKDAAKLCSVHGIVETGDDELWVATVGEGVYRLRIAGTQGHPEVTECERVIFDAYNADANAFFSIMQQNDSILWLGNRGMGAYRFNRRTHHLNVIDLTGKGNAVANDVFCVASTSPANDTVYCGTSDGTYRIFRSQGGKWDYEKIAAHDRNPVRSVHAILDGGERNLIASTNFGLTDYQLPGMSYISYGSDTDFAIRQFSDGAAYRDPASGTLYFGGANGFVTLRPTAFDWNGYTPAVTFRSLLIGNQTVSLRRYLDSKGRLTLPHDLNNFTVSFIAPDYRLGSHYIYRYRLSEGTDQWIETFTPEVPFTNLSPGRYTLEVEYHNGLKWSEPYTLGIIVNPPFYASTAAKIIYAILLVLFITALIILTVRIQHRKQSEIVKAMEQKRKEDVYEAKLKFFTNITHELLTPLTLVNGSCERMMADTGLSAQNRRLTNTIHKNSSRLTELIQELIEFRRIDSEYRKPDIEMLDVSALTEEIVDNFTVLAEKKAIAFKSDIDPAIMWPTDRSGFITIVTNLLSNAMKYTPEQGGITLSLKEEADKLRLWVENTGEGIRPENLSQIFDRYKVLERFERLSAAGTIKRNGLGLAVCEGLVRLLGGSIKAESEPGDWTRFSVDLPRIEVTRTEPSKDIVHYEKQIELPEEPEPTPEPISTEENSDKPLIFVIDDNVEMLTFIAESLGGSYRVARFTSAEDAAESMQKEWPALIVCDVVMDGMDGIEFACKVKSDKATRHIPFVQLSSLHAEDEKIKALEAGADVYVTKPFKTSYLTAVIDRLLKRKQNLKEYFDSSISSFENVKGQMIHSDDQEFLQKLLKVIEDNLTNPQLSTAFVAEALGLSVRNLYRRLEGITDQTPTVIIKEMRLSTAKNLLTHTTLSIDEIIYRVGFNNRGTFFKVFQQKMGCTPKQYRESQLAAAKSDLGISEASPS